ncbi:hypothetical protein K7W03_20455 [Sphingobium sp. PNB]|uniref:hypothetical protein n=1 Tax=Sphingobium sp. PNB TaxID=863934 RepID=UPI001CA41165|nr:hypothetical protein [Sphingobium sp. PNB]MCB4861967.1 hypothetical protein [Sphingobium sp. PNB]
MKARLLVSMAGNPSVDAGHIVEGDEAVRLIAAGFAEPVETEERATAPLSKTTKKAVKPE